METAFVQVATSRSLKISKTNSKTTHYLQIVNRIVKAMHYLQNESDEFRRPSAVHFCHSLRQALRAIYSLYWFYGLVCSIGFMDLFALQVAGDCRMVGEAPPCRDLVGSIRENCTSTGSRLSSILAQSLIHLSRLKWQCQAARCCSIDHARRGLRCVCVCVVLAV